MTLKKQTNFFKLRLVVFGALSSFIIYRPGFSQTSSDPFQTLFNQMRKRFEQFDKQMQVQLNNEIQVVWIDVANGRRLKITPATDEDIPLEINIENSVVSIKGKVIKANETENGSSQVTSEFQQSLSVPNDLDDNNPKFEKGSKKSEVVIFFPFKNFKAQKK